MLRAGRQGRLLWWREGGRYGVRLPLTNMDPGTQIGSTDPTVAAWQDFHGRLRGFVAGRVHDSADAEDIVQQVFLKMHRSSGTLRNREGVSGWLFRTARNAIADHYRAPVRRREVTVGDTRELDQRATPRPERDAVEAAACAATCLPPLLERLPAVYRRAIERVEIEGMTQRQAAAIEGVTVSGMKTRVQRARKRLKGQLLELCGLEVDARGAVVACETHARGSCERCRE